MLIDGEVLRSDIRQKLSTDFDSTDASIRAAQDNLAKAIAEPITAHVDPVLTNHESQITDHEARITVLEINGVGGGEGGGPASAAVDVTVAPIPNLSAANAQAAFAEHQGDINSLNSAVTSLQGDVANRALLTHDHADVYQPIDSDLTAIAALAGNAGWLQKVSAGVWSLDTSTYVKVGATTVGDVTLDGVLTVQGVDSETLFRAYGGVILRTHLNARGVQYWEMLSDDDTEVGRISYGTPDNKAGITFYSAGPAYLNRSDFKHLGAGGGFVWAAHADNGLPPDIMTLSPTHVSGKGLLSLTGADHVFFSAESSDVAKQVGLNLRRAGALLWSIYSPGSSGDLRFYSGSDLMVLSSAGVLSLSGNTVWHAGNDGPGSFLDADLLDGQHASAFALAVHSHAGEYATDAALTGHLNDTADAHAASAIGTTDASNVQAKLDALEAAGPYQPLDDDLTAIAALVGTEGLLKKTAADTWELDTTVYATDAELIAHLNDTASAHFASAITMAGGGTLQTRIETIEDSVADHITTGTHTVTNIALVGGGTLNTKLDEIDAAIADHLADATDAHDASAISTNDGSNVQAKLTALEGAVDTAAFGRKVIFGGRQADTYGSNYGAAPTLLGTAQTTYPDTTRLMLSVAPASGVEGTTGGFIGPVRGPVALIKPKLTMYYKTSPSGIGYAHLWVGFGQVGTTSPSYAGRAGAWFKYDPFDIYWGCSINAASGSGSGSGSNVSVTANTLYKFSLDWSDPTQVLFYINDALVATKPLTDISGDTLDTSLPMCEQAGNTNKLGGGTVIAGTAILGAYELEMSI